ncbi:MAG: ABC transporter permease [Clostridia bacterium]|nr:ABC transporter permease [Clostridia bacterium]
MFIHNFKYTLKTLFGNKILIFWTFAFPIIMATFFNLAFSNIENSEKLSIIDIAIVESEEFKNNEILKQSFEALSDEENKDRLFSLKYVQETTAKELLENGEITGYLKLDEDKPKIVIKSNGINESILKYVTEEITSTSKIVQDLANKKIVKESMQGKAQVDYEKIYKKALEIATKEDISFKNISNANLSYTMIEFYTLIAMTCLYGGILAMTAINNSLANMGNVGKRTAVAPISKGKLIISSVFASYITQLIGISLLFIYTIFILKVDYGNNLPLIVLLTLVGSLAGLSLGLVVATTLKTNENAKTGILLAVTMFGCFLSGMMGITMKYIVDKNVPIINKLNPASMITDGLYSLYYYDTFSRYYINVISLLIFSSIMIAISIIQLRKQKYETL